MNGCPFPPLFLPEKILLENAEICCRDAEICGKIKSVLLCWRRILMCTNWILVWGVMMKENKKRNGSIKIRLIAIIIPIVLIMVVSFFFLSRNMVLKSSKENLRAKSQVSAEKITGWKDQILGELQVYQNTIEEGNFADDDEILAYMKTSVEKSESYPVGLYMGDDSGVYLDGSGWVPDDDWVLTERDWYIDGKDNKNFAFGEPYYDSMTGQVCVSASVRVNDKKAVRVLATDVYLDYVSGIVSDISQKGDMEAFLVTKKTQTVIAHPDKKMSAVTLKKEGLDPLYGEIGSALAGNPEGILSVHGSEGTYFASIHTIEGTDWTLVTYVKEQKVLSGLLRMEMIMAVIAIAAALVLILVILRIMNHIVKPVKSMTEVIDQIAEGDFSHNLETKGTDEIARMSKNMQTFISQMRGTIMEITDTAGWLEHQSVKNGEVSESLKISSENQAKEMELLGKMVDQLSTAAEAAASHMDHLASLIQQTNRESDAAEQLMQESVAMSQNGKTDMERIDSGMTSINGSIEMLSGQISRVGNSILQIGNMVNLIIEIAEETNLLSLNASIEAARAGEAGKGFAVVADQIGKLAMSSSNAADEISKLTEEIQDTVSEAVNQMNSSVGEVQANVGIVSEASATFENLYGKVEETSSRVKQMVLLVGKVEKVARQMEQISGSQAQATEQIVQSTEQLRGQTHNVTEGSFMVAENAGELKRESRELMGRISRFKA